MASMTETVNDVASTIRTALGGMLAETNELKKKLAQWTDLQDKIKQEVANPPNLVKLNVGGTMFETSKHNLLREEGSYFHALLGSGSWKPEDTTNAYFLDMDPTLFRRVLIYLRTGTMMPLDGLTKPERNEFKAMLEYLKVCSWGDATPVVRWSTSNKPVEVTLSNDMRTAEKTCREYSGGVIATEALRGTFQLRIEVARRDFYVGLCPPAGFDSRNSDTTRDHCYRYCANGDVFRKKSKIATLVKLQEGDVVTIQRCALDVTFTVNDGAPVQVPLVDLQENLFPVVHMFSPGPLANSVQTKVTVVDYM